MFTIFKTFFTSLADWFKGKFTSAKTKVDDAVTKVETTAEKVKSDL